VVPGVLVAGAGGGTDGAVCGTGVSVGAGAELLGVGVISGTASARALTGKDKTKNKDNNMGVIRFFIIGLLLCNKIRSDIICNSFVSSGKALA
jgi:hypothetical protein